MKPSVISVVDQELLEEIGIKISMDDFGTGYSSMSYLSQLDINELKIDQSFVRALLNSPRDKIIVRAIIKSGGKL